jgi:RimJ/RimL family protein N-acetyltransferase
MRIFETDRLYFRHLVPDDLDSLYTLYRDPEIRRYFPVESLPDGTLTYEETKEELEWFLNGHPKHPELGLWATVLKENGQFAGRCGLLSWTIEERDEVEIAYMIAKEHWGRGLGSEAAMGLRDYAFEQLGLSRLICLIHPANKASVKVATRTGMAFEKPVVDRFGMAHLYAMEK